MRRRPSRSFSSLIAANPAAPASITDAAFFSSIPPSASTGNGRTDSTADRSASSPFAAPFPGVSKTGPYTARSAPRRTASSNSSSVCVDTPIMNFGPKCFRTTPAEIEFDVRCTPAHPTAAAMSARSLISIFAPVPAAAEPARLARSNIFPAESDFSRICISCTPKRAASEMSSIVSVECR